MPDPDTFIDDARFVLEALPRLTARADEINQLRQTILGLAVRGTLNTNAPHDEPAELPTNDRKVRRGVPDDVPMPKMVRAWSLPPNWRALSVAAMLRSGLLVDLKDGNHGENHPKKSDYEASGLPFIAATHVRDHQIDYDGAPKITGAALEKIRIGRARPGDVIFTHKATIGRVAIADRECILTPQTTYYRVNARLLLNSYLMRFLESEMAACQYADVVIPEQHRIVGKVNELLALCDKLEAGLIAVDEIRRRLLEALRAEALAPEKDHELEAAE